MGKINKVVGKRGVGETTTIRSEMKSSIMTCKTRIKMTLKRVSRVRAVKASNDSNDSCTNALHSEEHSIYHLSR